MSTIIKQEKHYVSLHLFYHRRKRKVKGFKNSRINYMMLIEVFKNMIYLGKISCKRKCILKYSYCDINYLEINVFNVCLSMMSYKKDQKTIFLT